MRLKKYISILLMLLVCVPVVDRAYDQYSHRNEVHCDDVHTHYCATEHHCAVCDYVFAAAADLPFCAQLQPLFAVKARPSRLYKEKFLPPSTVVFPNLRGPPTA